MSNHRLRFESPRDLIVDLEDMISLLAAHKRVPFGALLRQCGRTAYCTSSDTPSLCSASPFHTHTHTYTHRSCCLHGPHTYSVHLHTKPFTQGISPIIIGQSSRHTFVLLENGVNLACIETVKPLTSRSLDTARTRFRSIPGHSTTDASRANHRGGSNEMDPTGQRHGLDCR